MKAQDLIFIVVIVGVLFFRNKNLAITLGLLSLMLAIPLFIFQIFFTAERLVMYGAGLLFLSLLFLLKDMYYRRK